MKVSLNQYNVLLCPVKIGICDCSQCCFSHNLDLCHNEELRDSFIICRSMKIQMETPLEDIFTI